MLNQRADLAQVAQRQTGPKFIKISTLGRYRPEDIDAWIAEQKAGSGVAQEVR